MNKTVRQLIKDLQNVREDLKDKEVVIVAENGIDFEPKVKYRTKEPLDFSKENVEKVVITA